MSAREEVQKVLDDKEQLDQFVKAAFDTVDEDGSGYIEKNELMKVMTQVANDVGCKPPTEKEFLEVRDELDTDGDKKISLEEFKVLIVEVLKGLEAEME